MAIVILSWLWLLRGWGGFEWTPKQKNSHQKSFFQIILKKSLWKLISPDVKTNVKQQEKKKNCWLYLVNFHKKYFRNLKCNVKTVWFFIWFWLIFHPACYWWLRTGGRGLLLNRKYLLSVTEVIFQCSLITIWVI